MRVIMFTENGKRRMDERINGIRRMEDEIMRSYWFWFGLIYTALRIFSGSSNLLTIP